MMRRRDFITESPESTMRLGYELGKLLKEGDIITLDGDLGAGKTHFTNGIARALGIDGYITSPTFTIVNEYRYGRLPLFHFDIYRLSSAEDLYDIGFEDYLNMGGVVVVEWARRIEGFFNDNCICVEILRNDDLSPERRAISICMNNERIDDIAYIGA